MTDKKLIAALLASPERYALLGDTCKRLGAKLRCISQSELSLTVDEVCRSAAEQPEEPFPERELLLFSGFSGEELGAAVKALRQAGLYVPLKAVRTASNGGWSLAALLDELSLEYEYMKQRKKEQNEPSAEV